MKEVKYIKDNKLYDEEHTNPESVETVYSYGSLQDAINIPLVAADVRPACALEGHYVTAQHIIDSYYKDKGLIVSPSGFVAKKLITPSMVNTYKKIGQIIGFGKCASNLVRSETKRTTEYSIGLSAKLKGLDKFNIAGGSDEMTFFNMICSKKENMPDMELFRKKCEDVLKSDPLFKDIIEKVNLEITTNINIPTKVIIDTLMRGAAIDADMKKRINSTLEWLNMSLNNFDLHNSLHRGMLMTILSVDTPLDRDEDKAGLLKTLRQTRKAKKASKSGKPKTRKQKSDKLL